MTPDGEDGVLVLDSDGQCALSIVRSLGSKGIPVTAGSSTPWSLGRLSRYSDDWYVYPDPTRDCRAFLEVLQSHLDQSDYDIVIPANDATALLVAQHKPTLEATGTRVACEDWPTFRRVYDKGALFETISPLDVPTPETHSPESIEAVEAMAPDLDYPVVVKPRSKSHLVDNAVETTLVTDDNYARSPAELVRTYRRFVEGHEGLTRQYPLVQAYVPGRTTTTVGLAIEGTFVEFFQEVRLRTYPASGGNSALLGSMRDRTMLDHAETVLTAVDWTGPAMVEFMQTPDGEFSVIEVNGRYWGSLPFAIESGVDIPWHHYRHLMGHRPVNPRPSGAYRTDIVQRRLFYEDCKWLVENLARGNVAAVAPFLGDFLRTRHTFVDDDDPLPTLAVLAQAGWLGSTTGWAELRGRSTGSPVPDRLEIRSQGVTGPGLTPAHQRRPLGVQSVFPEGEPPAADVEGIEQPRDDAAGEGVVPGSGKRQDSLCGRVDISGVRRRLVPVGRSVGPEQRPPEESERVGERLRVSVRPGDLVVPEQRLDDEAVVVGVHREV
ncbi:carboxylate--amine ligase [Halomicroarcula sp. GCM10025709]